MTEYRKASNLALVSWVTAGISGSLIGYPLGWYLGSGDWSSTELVLLGSGIATGILSVILSVTADRRFDEAIVSYNDHLRLTFGAE